MRTRTSGSCGRSLYTVFLLVLLSACSSPIAIVPAVTEIPVAVTSEATAVTETPDEATPTDVPPTPTVVVEPTAVPTIQCTVKSVRGLRLRAGPGTENSIVTTLAAGDVLTASGRNTESDWVAVSTSSGAQGWVAANFVDCGDGLPKLPVATPSSAP